MCAKRRTYSRDRVRPRVPIVVAGGCVEVQIKNCKHVPWPSLRGSTAHSGDSIHDHHVQLQRSKTTYKRVHSQKQGSTHYKAPSPGSKYPVVSPPDCFWGLHVEADKWGLITLLPPLPWLMTHYQASVPQHSWTCRSWVKTREITTCWNSLHPPATPSYITCSVWCGCGPSEHVDMCVF